MNYWTALHRTIEKNLAGGRIGTPVFARCTLALPAAALDEQGARLYRALALMGRSISAWLEADIQTLHLIGTAEQGCVSLDLECRSGATALLSLSITAQQPHLDLTLLGNNGAIYHQEAPQLLPGNRFLELSQPGVHLARLLDAIEQAASSGQPVRLDVGRSA